MSHVFAEAHIHMYPKNGVFSLPRTDSMALKHQTARASCFRAVKLGALATLALSAILPATAFADITAWGPKNNSCGTWVAERGEPGPKLWQREARVVGFLSGMAEMQSGSDFLQGLDPNAVYIWLDNHCRAHPLDNVATALNKLADERGVKRGGHWPSFRDWHSFRDYFR